MSKSKSIQKGLHDRPGDYQTARNSNDSNDDEMNGSPSSSGSKINSHTLMKEEEAEQDEEEENDSDNAGLTQEEEYERERMENIKQNATLLASLGLASIPSIRPHQAVSSSSKIKTKTNTKIGSNVQGNNGLRMTRSKRESRSSTLEPTRRSGRVAARIISEDGVGIREDELGMKRKRSISPRKPLFKPLPKSITPIIPPGPIYDDDDEYPLQTNAPKPSRHSDGTLIFEGRWKGIFTPNVTPQEMFDGGAFGGGFFVDTFSQVLKSPLSSSNSISSLPFDPPTPRKRSTHYCNPEPDGSINRFKIRAGQSLQEWEKAGWIWNGDPRGWAEWYTRFWGGRRCEDDERQVRRWLKVAGPTGRFKRSLLKKIHMAGGLSALEDEEVGRVLRQTLWQWGYVMNNDEWRKAMLDG